MTDSLSPAQKALDQQVTFRSMYRALDMLHGELLKRFHAERDHKVKAELERRHWMVSDLMRACTLPAIEADRAAELEAAAKEPPLSREALAKVGMTNEPAAKEKATRAIIAEITELRAKDDPRGVEPAADPAPSTRELLTDLEIEFLRDMSGEKTSITSWGSWMTPALSALRGMGYVERHSGPGGTQYQITAKGKQFLTDLPAGAFVPPGDAGGSRTSPASSPSSSHPLSVAEHDVAKFASDNREGFREMERKLASPPVPTEAHKLSVEWRGVCWDIADTLALDLGHRMSAELNRLQSLAGVQEREMNDFGQMFGSVCDQRDEARTLAATYKAENERLRECAAVNQTDWAKEKLRAENAEAERDAALERGFKVEVSEMKESHQTTYWVVLTRNGASDSVFDGPAEGRITPFKSTIREHAEHEAKEWAAFLQASLDKKEPTNG